MRTAARLEPFGTTIFADITARAAAAQAVNLGQGMPDFDGPDLIKDAAARAMRTHPNQYAPMPGVPELRRAIAGFVDVGSPIDADSEVTVTAGCTGALAACHLGLFELGDEVVTFEPYYDAYAADAALAGAVSRAVPLRIQGDGSFTFDPTELRSSVKPNTRAVLLNTPHNPTGKVFTRDELAEVASIAIDHDLIVIADEVYDRLVFDGARHVSIASLPSMRERTITLGSFGKSFSLTGWKIGWAVAPPPLTAAVRAAHQFINFAIATPLQHAAAEAISDSGAHFETFATDFQGRRDRLGAVLSDLGFVFDPPAGGYFILADHSAVSRRVGVDGDVELCRWLIEQAGVATIPPTAFYAHEEHGRHLLRFAFCKELATLDEAADRLRRALG
ncbi:MAG: aminotransferase class I/II-fold pyridoxal phosphate-dependent enzyme [Planctomycetota bacterium]